MSYEPIQYDTPNTDIQRNYDTLGSMVDTLQTKKLDKVNSLSERRNNMFRNPQDPLTFGGSTAPGQVVEDERGRRQLLTEDGYLENLGNKIFNQMSPAEIQWLIGDMVNTHQLDPRAAYDGSRRLYGYQNDGTGEVKIGIARGDLPSADYRYQPGRAESEGLVEGEYGWESPMITNPEAQKGMDLQFPNRIAIGLEYLLHGREGGWENRAVRRRADETDPAAVSRQAREQYGNGSSEWYKGGYEGAFGDSRGADLELLISDTPEGEARRNELRSLFYESIGLGQETASTGPITAEQVREERLRREASNMGVGGRIANAVKGFGASFIRAGIVDPVDMVGELTGLWNLGTREEKKDAVDRIFRFNPYAAEAGMERASELGQKMVNDWLDPDKAVDVSDFFKIAWEAFKNPEIVGESLGTTFSMIIPYLGVAGKATKVGSMNRVIADIDKSRRAGLITAEQARKQVIEAKQGVTLAQRTIDMARRNSGIVVVSAGEVNNQIDEYKELHGEDPSLTKVASMVATTTVLYAIDLKVDLGILKNTKGAISSMADAVAALPGGDRRMLINSATKVVGTLAASGAKEAMQEYSQTMGEILNVQWNFDSEGNPTAIDILTSPENVAEGVTAAGIGAGMGVEMSAAGQARTALTERGLPLAERLTNKEPEIGLKKEDTEAIANREKEIKQRAEQFTNSEPLSTVVSQSAATGDVDAIQRKIDERVEAVRIMEEMGETRFAEIGRREIEELKAQLPQTRILGSDPISRKNTISGMFELLGEQGIDTTVLEQFAQVNNLNQEEVTLVNNSVAQGARIAAIKKNMASVNEEVSSGARGYITYYNNIREGITRGDEKLVETNLQNLNRFTTAQMAKLRDFRAAEAEVLSSINTEIESLIDQQGITKDEAISRVGDKYVVGPNGKATYVKFKYPSGSRTYKINKGAVFERHFDGNTNPIGFYSLMQEVENEVTLMVDAYNAISAEVLGPQADTTATPVTNMEETAPIEALDPTAQPEPTVVETVQEVTGMLDNTVFEGLDEAPDFSWEGLDAAAEQSMPVEQEAGVDPFASIEADSTVPTRTGYYTGTVDSRVGVFRGLKQRLKEVNKNLLNNPENEALLEEKSNIEASLQAALPEAFTSHPNISKDLVQAAPGMIKVSEGVDPNKQTFKDLLEFRPTGLTVENVTPTEQLLKEIRDTLSNNTTQYGSQINAVRMLLGRFSPNINPHVAVAVEGALQGYLGENIDALTTPKDVTEIAEMLNIQDTNNLPMDAVIALADGGELIKYAADSIGQKVMESLGIRGDNVADSLEASIRSGFGMIAIRIGQERGWIQNFESASFTMNSATVNLVKAGPKLFEDLKEIKDRNVDYENAFGITLDTSRNYVTSMPEVRKRGIRNQPYTTLTELQVNALEKLESVEFEFNSGIEVLMEMYPERVDLLKALGWEDTEVSGWKNSTPADLQLAIKGKNRSIENEVDSLLDAIKDNPESMYFNWFGTKAGRFNLDSTKLNPQTQKNLARWLVSAKGSKGTVSKVVLDGLTGKEDVTNRSAEEKQAVMFAYGIVQAFDGSSIENLPAIDKNNEADIIKAAKEILAMPREDLVKYAKESAHLGHAASAIANIAKYQEASTEFESDLQIEFDGLTNGFSFKTMQHPVLAYEDMVKWWRKIGVVTDDSVDSMNEREKGFEDVYMAAGAVAGNEAILKEELSKDNSKDWDLLQKAKKSKLQTVLNKVGMKADLEGSTLRNLMKGPVMVFVYSAGIPSIKRAIVKDKVNEFLVALTKKEGGKYVLKNDELTEALGLPITTDVRKLMSKRSLLDPSMNDVRVRLEQHFTAVYSNPVGAALNRTFGEYIALNGVINNAFSLAYEAFKSKYVEVDPHTMSRKEKQEFIKKYLALAPMIKGPDSKGLNDQILVMSRALEELDLPNTVQMDAYTKARIVNKDDSTRVVQLILRGLGAPGAAGNVLPIQTMDGSTMGRTLLDSENGFLGVHDALVLGVNGFDSVLDYNKNWWAVNDDANLVRDTMNMLERVQQELQKEGIMESKISLPAVGDRDPVTIQSTVNNLKNYLSTIESNREKLDQNKNLKAGQMVGPRGTMAKRNLASKEKAKIRHEKENKDKLRKKLQELGNYKGNFKDLSTKERNIYTKIQRMVKGIDAGAVENTKKEVERFLKGQKDSTLAEELLDRLNPKEKQKVEDVVTASTLKEETAVSKIKATPIQINKADKEC